MTTVYLLISRIMDFIVWISYLLVFIAGWYLRGKFKFVKISGKVTDAYIRNIKKEGVKKWQ